LANRADGFIFAGKTVDDFMHEWQLLQKLLIEGGRSGDGFGTYCLIVNDGFRSLDTKEVAEASCRWNGAGGTHASIVTIGRGFKTAEYHIDYFNDIRGRLG
jgi:hypothetical protein